MRTENQHFTYQKFPIIVSPLGIEQKGEVAVHKMIRGMAINAVTQTYEGKQGNSVREKSQNSLESSSVQRMNWTEASARSAISRVAKTMRYWRGSSVRCL